METGKIKAGTCQPRSQPCNCAVKTPCSAPSLMIPLRRSAGSWAAQKVGCRRLKVVRGARCQRPRKPLACSGRGDTAPRAGREEKDARGLDNSGNIEGFFIFPVPEGPTTQG